MAEAPVDDFAYFLQQLLSIFDWVHLSVSVADSLCSDPNRAFVYRGPQYSVLALKTLFYEHFDVPCYFLLAVRA